MWNFKNKIIFITGSAKRVGFEMAKAAAKRGAIIVVHYRSSKDEAEESLKVIQELSPKSILIQGDQSVRKDIDRMTLEIEEAFGKLDALVNSASVFPEIPFEETAEDDFDDIINANLRGPYFLTKAMLPLIQKSDAGQIVNIVDAMNQRPSSKYSAYFASKGALETLTLALACELAPEIRVNGIAPGPVMEPEKHSEARRDKILERLPLQRWGTPEAVAQAVMCVLENDFMTGSIVKVDGGRSIE